MVTHVLDSPLNLSCAPPTRLPANFQVSVYCNGGPMDWDSFLLSFDRHRPHTSEKQTC